MPVLVVTGTGTGVGKTVVTAAVAALARDRGEDVAVIKPAQTGVMPGEPGDLDEVRRLAGPVAVHELARFTAALSPEAAARVAGSPPADLGEAARLAAKLAEGGRRVLIEGAGGLAVRYDHSGTTIADLAATLAAPVLLVTTAGLGTLNHTALTLEAMAARGLRCAGVVIGCWPRHPDLAMRCNISDLRVLSGEPLAGAVGEGAGALGAAGFLTAAREALSPALGGTFDPARFARRHDWREPG